MRDARLAGCGVSKEERASATGTGTMHFPMTIKLRPGLMLSFPEVYETLPYSFLQTACQFVGSEGEHEKERTTSLYAHLFGI